jgi:hypothetical protein
VQLGRACDATEVVPVEVLEVERAPVVIEAVVHKHHDLDFFGPMTRKVHGEPGKAPDVVAHLRTVHEDAAPVVHAVNDQAVPPPAGRNARLR